MMDDQVTAIVEIRRVLDESCKGSPPTGGG